MVGQAVADGEVEKRLLAFVGLQRRAGKGDIKSVAHRDESAVSGGAGLRLRRLAAGSHKR